MIRSSAFKIKSYIRTQYIGKPNYRIFPVENPISHQVWLRQCDSHEFINLHKFLNGFQKNERNKVHPVLKVILVEIGMAAHERID